MHRYNKTEKVAAPPLASKRPMDQVCERIRYLHYSLKTEKAYLYWVRFFILWTAKQGGMRLSEGLSRQLKLACNQAGIANARNGAHTAPRPIPTIMSGCS
jgi:hypothetical protein